MLSALLLHCGNRPTDAGQAGGAREGKSEASMPLTVTVEHAVIPGFREHNTPDDFNRVGYRRYSLRGQRNIDMPILIIISGYVADTAWFDRMARDLVMRKNVEVWTVSRRETLVEDRPGLERDMALFMKDEKQRDGILRKMNSVSNYLLCNESMTRHWGLQAHIEDMNAVVEAAARHSRSIFIGGWSDGVEYAMMYANYRFGERFGASKIRGLVFFDENPEWGEIQKNKAGNEQDIRRQEELMAGEHLYMKYTPSLVVHTLALRLAAEKPHERSPLAVQFRLPKELIDRGVTNRALIGWLYDKDIEGYDSRLRGDFAYLLRSGTFSRENDGKRPVAWKDFRESGDVSDLGVFTRSYNAAGAMWEYFYPRKVLLDYFLLGRCDFNCPEFSVFVNRENTLPVFYILTGTNNVGNGVPSGLAWYMEKTGITADRVKFMRLYDYAHADMFYAHDAPARLYGPLHRWMEGISGAPQEKKTGGNGK